MGYVPTFILSLYLAGYGYGICLELSESPLYLGHPLTFLHLILICRFCDFFSLFGKRRGFGRKETAPPAERISGQRFFVVRRAPRVRLRREFSTPFSFVLLGSPPSYSWSSFGLAAKRHPRFFRQRSTTSSFRSG